MQKEEHVLRNKKNATTTLFVYDITATVEYKSKVQLCQQAYAFRSYEIKSRRINANENDSMTSSQTTRNVLIKF